MNDSRAGWDQDAADDVRSPSVGAVIRWAHRAARAKAELGIADRVLQALLARQRDVIVARLALGPSALAEVVEQHSPVGEIIDAERALADAIEAEDFAARVCRLLERPRATTAEKAAPRLVAQQGGKR